MQIVLLNSMIYDIIENHVKQCNDNDFVSLVRIPRKWFNLLFGFSQH